MFMSETYNNEATTIEAHADYISTVVSGEHSHSKTSAIIAVYDISTMRVFVRYKTESYSKGI